MVQVKLNISWVGGDGVAHAAGDTILVDEATAALLIAQNIATAAAGPGKPGGGVATPGWNGPS